MTEYRTPLACSSHRRNECGSLGFVSAKCKVWPPIPPMDSSRSAIMMGCCLLISSLLMPPLSADQAEDSPAANITMPEWDANQGSITEVRNQEELGQWINIHRSYRSSVMFEIRGGVYLVAVQMSGSGRSSSTVEIYERIDDKWVQLATVGGIPGVISAKRHKDSIKLFVIRPRGTRFLYELNMVNLRDE